LVNEVRTLKKGDSERGGSEEMVKNILVLGSGLDLSIALEFCKKAVKVYYYSSWSEGFPQLDKYLVGYGFERFGLEIVKDFYRQLRCIWDIDKENWLVVFTDNNFGDLPDMLRDEGFIVFGSGLGGSSLELDRDWGKSVLSEFMDVPDFRSFRTLNEVMDYLRNEDDFSRKYVLKVDAVSGSIDTVVGTVDELLSGIDKIDDVMKGLELNWVLERFIDGVEVAVGAFFNGNGFLYPIVRSFESEWGGYLIWGSKDVIFEETLGKMGAFLSGLGYNGMIDINGILSDDGRFYALEWTAGRFGYPWGRIYTRMINNIVDVFNSIAEGEDCDIDISYNCAYFISAFSDFDFSENSENFYDCGDLYKLDKEDDKAIVYDRVMISEDVLYSLPGYNRMFQMVGFGNDFDSAFKNAKEIYSKCKIICDFKDKFDELYKDLNKRLNSLDNILKNKEN